ncbi:MAG: hypothetical protein K9M44_04855 [Candidatus Pacebacteria bacterium]|nr:hypothetical protein [Candidatus Paceibacterota bacterium]
MIEPWRIELNYNNLKDTALKQDTVIITCQKQDGSLTLKMKLLGFKDFKKSLSSKKFNVKLNPEDLANYAKSIIKNKKAYQNPEFVKQVQNFLLQKGTNDSVFLSLNSKLNDSLYNLINKNDSLREVDSLNLMQQKVNKFVSLKINHTQKNFKDTLTKTEFLSNLDSFMFAQTSQDSALLIKLKQQIVKELENFWQTTNSVRPDTIIDYQDFYRNNRLQNGITDAELAQLLKGLKIKNKEVSLMMFDSAFDLPANMFLVDLIDYESNYQHEKMFLANLVFTALDVNTDGVINIRDDVTNNGAIDTEDFKMFFGIQTDIATKYGENFQHKEIVINDLLFLKSQDLSNGKAIRGTVNYTGFKPFFEKTVSYRTTDYHEWQEHASNKIVQGQGSYYQTGFLGLVTGYVPGEIKSIPIYSNKAQEVYLEKTYIHTEILGPVEVVAFQIEMLNGNYIAFFFDASEVNTEIIEQEITQNYLNKKKAESDRQLISVKNTRDKFSQKTSGRVTILDVDLKLQCSFFKGKFQRAYYLGQENLQQGATSSNKPEKVIAPFKEIYAYIENSDDFENLGQLTREIRNSKSESAIGKINKYLTIRETPEISYKFLTPCWSSTSKK